MLVRHNARTRHDMNSVKYLLGDATNPIGEGKKLIVHVCNDIGGWGKGFVLAISKKWNKPEAEFKKWYSSGTGFALGEVQFVQVEQNIWIANLIGQRDISRKAHPTDIPPVRYDAIRAGLEKVAAFALENELSIHMPRIGCGLAGGKWEFIEPIITEVLSSKNIETTVYDFQ